MLSTRFILSFVFITLSSAFAQTNNFRAVISENQNNKNLSNFQAENYNGITAIKTPVKMNKGSAVQTLKSKEVTQHLVEKPGWSTQNPANFKTELATNKVAAIDDGNNEAKPVVATQKTEQNNFNNARQGKTVNIAESSLMLRPVSKELLAGSPRKLKIICDLILKANEPIDGIGVSGSIDLSGFLLQDEDTVEVVAALTSLFDDTEITTTYYPELKVLCFTLLKTDKADIEIDNKPLLRIAIVFEEDIGKSVHKNTFRIAIINYSGIMQSSGSFAWLKSSNNKFIDMNNGIFRTGEQLVPDLNLVTRNADCSTLGSAEICKPESLSGNVSLEQIWSNGRTSSEITGLVSGDYNVKVKYAGTLVEEVDFEIDDDADVTDHLNISDAVLKSGRYSASESINLNNIEVPIDQTVEFNILDCD